ncbi:hypothetical protein VHEMI08914 [[Torrubiella] hemipterigena]|uniref:Peptidase S8/S53 domain-containing protein n=1 Tax=[Torrubiella] hemipterigena TaxID=1531966 RepID=A0A0A1TP33_9HYPO|nr:hypothetical protein VHEMI08914 [[Torrubiella] hemipterigena]
MSLVGDPSDTFDDAIEEAFKQGILTVVASGNDNKDCSNLSPARAAIRYNRDRWYWGTSSNSTIGSNYGAPVDIHASGAEIVSTFIGDPDAAETFDGTSGAAPLVSGLALYLMVLENITTPAAVTNRIKDLGTKNVVNESPAGTVNLLAFNGIDSATKPKPYSH